MKICSRCYQTAEDSVHFCENCGAPLDGGSGSVSPDALPAGLTLFGRYVIGQVLRQDDASFTYLAQDSRTKGPVAVREYFPGGFSRRTSMGTVSVPEESRETFQEGKELFLEEAEDLSDRYDSEEPPCVQSYFNQNNTAYLAVDYGTPENLRRFLDREDFQIDRQAPSSDPQQAEARNAGPSPEGSARRKTDAPSGKAGAAPNDGSGSTPDRAADGRSGSAPDHLPGTASGEDPGGISADRAAASAEVSGSISGGRPADSAKASGSISAGRPADSAEASGGISAGRPADSKAAERPTPAGGGKKPGLGLALVLFAFILATLIALVVLLLRIFSFFPRTGRYISPFFRDFQHQIMEWKNKPEETKEQKPQNPLKDLFSGKNTWKGIELTDAEIGEAGISSGNFYNQGFYLLYDDACYFSDSYGLFRAASPEDLEDLEDCERLQSGSISYLNEYEGYVYFLDEIEGLISRLDPDGDTIETIYSSAVKPEYSPETLLIYDGWCYFSHKRNLYRFDLDQYGGSGPLGPEEAEPVVEDFNFPGKMFESLCPVRGKLVYNGLHGITAIDPDGGNAETISDQEGNLISDGNSLYCIFGVNKIYRISMDGESELIVNTDASEPLTKYNCADGYLYYTTEREGLSELYRVSTDGEETEFLCPAGEDGEILISLCAFPDAEGIYVYKLLKQEEGLLSLHERLPVE